MKSLEEFRQEFRWHFQTNLQPMAPFELRVLKRAGRYSYGDLNVAGYGGEDESLEIGEYVSLGPGTVFHLGGEHPLDYLSTFPFEYFVLGKEYDPRANISKGPIVVKDDVWIGTRALILSGVTLHQGAVVGAGSVVTRDVPPYTIVGGNPAREIRRRFSKRIIQALVEGLDYSRMTPEIVRRAREILFQPLTEENMKIILLLTKPRP